MGTVKKEHLGHEFLQTENRVKGKLIYKKEQAFKSKEGRKFVVTNIGLALKGVPEDFKTLKAEQQKALKYRLTESDNADFDETHVLWASLQKGKMASRVEVGDEVSGLLNLTFKAGKTKEGKEALFASAKLVDLGLVEAEETPEEAGKSLWD